MKELLISNENEKKTIAIVEDGKLVEKYIENENNDVHEGNIYLGKVENVLPGMQAAFIDIGCAKNTFIHLKDILPKQDEKESNYNNEILNKVNIKKVIKTGMPILVQVKRDFTNSKGAKVSTHISITNRFLVLMPDTNILTISQKIENKEEKERLTNIFKKILPENYGAIIRTSALGKDEEILKKDLDNAIEKWKNIIVLAKKAEKNNYPKLIYKTNGIIKKLLIDLLDDNIDKIIVNNQKEYDYIIKVLNEIETNCKIDVILKKDENILYGISKQIEKAQSRKIWLKCGGFITIDRTEALTAIDVNSGKYIGNENLEKTVFIVNKEASIEIAKQLRLKDIGGIIIIDYINMKDEENKQKIINILEENLKKDRSKTQVIGFSKLDLLEMTRKHMYSIT